ncbi:MAG: ATP-binding cassette domain-containing protein [Chloroflexota bacterium]
MAIQEISRIAGEQAATHDPAIEVHDLEKTYAKGVKALQGVSFNVEPGSIFALLGPNGAGKSTAVKILTTLAKPTAGTACVAGFDVLTEPKRVRNAIGCVFQRSGVDQTATGRENLILQGQVYGMGGADLSRRADALLERVGLADSARRVVRGYSGGMQRRLDIAMGLIHQPKVLFLDEPTSGLDPEVRADLWAEIARLAHEEGLTILLTTHYLEEADRLAGRLVIVDRGKIVAAGTPDELKSQLGGDSIHVELADIDAGIAASALEKLEDLRDLVPDGNMLHARADQGAVAVPAVLSTLEGAGLKVKSVSVARASLDDVYLRYAGRSFSRADEEGSK